MAKIKPFRAWRPNADVVSKVAALPYDVYSRSEAAIEAQKEPLSFINIDRPETQFPPTTDIYADCVYEKASELLWHEAQKGIFLQDKKPCFYLYELTMNGRRQTGIVGCVNCEDYVNHVVKKHENLRPEKEKDRLQHINVCGAQYGPIFLTYHADASIDAAVNLVKLQPPIYDFVSEDGVGHRCWIIEDDARISEIVRLFENISALYIADGHHRASSAVKVCMERRKNTPNYDGSEEFNYFLSVLFPDNQLEILPYYRVVKDLNGLDAQSFLNKVSNNFEIEAYQSTPVAPTTSLSFGCYLENQWYLFKAKPNLYTNDPVDGLDVSILQNYILAPILGICDPATDSRIDFVGGIRGLKELENRCHTDMAIAFSTYATTLEQLFAVADQGRLMPPKSTWFEPKLRSGLFIHQI